MIIVTLVLALLLALAAAVLAIQNNQPVNISFFAWQADGGLALFLIIAYFAGLLTGVLLVLPGSVVNRTKLALANRKLDSIAKAAGGETSKKPAELPTDDKEVVS